ncbi:MAG: hypothetical protein R3B09_08925 [Nannocystaceae bacterium]
MKPITLPAAAALGGLVLGLAAPITAAALPTLNKPPPGALCGKTPTLAQCTDDNSTCAEAHHDTCKKMVEDALKNNPARAGAEKRTMLRPEGDDIPKDRREGAYYPYTPKKPIRGVKGITVLAPAVVGAPLATNKTAKAGHRSPAWDKDGPVVNTCEEYAYESIYDWGRFVDSAALCDGDGQCVYDVAYMKAVPGIARRTLQRLDKVPLAPQLPVLQGTAIDKNVMFSIDASWIYVNGDKALPATPELKEMEADFRKGQRARAIACPGCSGASEKYTDEWAYHTAMRQKLASVSYEEFEEYARRRAEFSRLLANWARAVHAEEERIKKAVDGKTVPRTFPTLPGERTPWDHVLDPLTRQQLFRTFDERALKDAKAILKVVTPSAVKSVSLPGGLFYVAPPAPAWGYGFVAPSLPTVTKPSTGKIDPKSGKVQPLNLNERACTDAIASGPAFARMDGHACLLAAFLREEWRRKKRGQLSCLDPSNDTCDWSPIMFRDRALALGEGYLSQQQRLQDECNAITVTGSLPGISLAKVPAHLEKIKATIAEAESKLAEYKLKPTADGVGKRYGTSKSDHGAWGEAGLFTSSYDYHFGWSVEPIELQNKVACKLQGDTNNGVKASATILKSSAFTLLDAVLEADANLKGNGKLHLKAWVDVLGNQLMGHKDLTVTQIFNEEKEIFRKDTPKVSFTFAAGPVPVTIAGWGEVTAGYHTHGEGRFNTQCDPKKDPEFAVVATFEPNVAANARAQVGVGISGIASAGIRGTINLLHITFPLTARLEIIFDKLAEEARAPFLSFNAGLQMTLSTLAGRMAFYVEALLYEDEWEIFSWSGLGPYKLDLMKLFDVKMPLIGMSAK